MSLYGFILRSSDNCSSISTGMIMLKEASNQYDSLSYLASLYLLKNE